MTLVDSHFHVNFNGFSLSDIIKYLDREHIDCCWLLSWEEINHGPWTYEHLPVGDLYEAFLKYPSRIIPFYAPDPHKNDATAQLENWHTALCPQCGYSPSLDETSPKANILNKDSPLVLSCNNRRYIVFED